MSSYGKYFKYIITFILILSLSTNVYFTIRLKGLNEKVSNSNLVISTNVESGIRDTIHSIKALKETGLKEEMIDLQRSIQQLVLSFSNWISLNQTEKNPNDVLMKGLKGLETLNSAVVHNLYNQYSSHNDQLTDYDLVFLDKASEQLDRFLVIYHNVQGRVSDIKGLSDNDGGLGQWASSVGEISRLYRHSRVPNEHPQYIPVDSILARVEKILPESTKFLKDSYEKEVVSENVKIRDGVHYYEANYYINDEIAYTVWIDAINGSLRQYEDYTRDPDSELVSQNEALNSAKSFIKQLDLYGKVIEGASSITDESTGDTIYAFQFTPVVDNIAMISDCIKVRVSSRGGRIIKYSSSFSKTQVPQTDALMSLEEVREKYSEQLESMKYSGMAVVRSFYTHYRPVLTYSYASIGKEKTKKLYFDVVTGNPVYEAYSVYEPVGYMNDENY